MIKIQKNISLAQFTTFKIGGPASFFVDATNEDELIEAMNFAKKNELEVFLLGGGSNVLISDLGFNGLVIRILNSKYQVLENEMECGVGMRLSEIVRLATENSLSGLEWAVGIPGTIGGAIRGNAGAYGGCISDNVSEVKFVDLQEDKLRLKVFKNEECNFSYRSSAFKENKNWIIISVVLKFEKGKKFDIEEKIKEIIRKRAEKIPSGQSAGSFFQNPIVKDENLKTLFEKETGLKCKDDKLPAGWLIEEAGLRGKKIGGAMLSEKHSNFIINTGNAKAEDVVMLSSLIKTRIRNKFGVQLKEEVEFVGF